MSHTDRERLLYRGVSMARNLAHLGYQDEAAEVARFATAAYQGDLDLETEHPVAQESNDDAGVSSS